MTQNTENTLNVAADTTVEGTTVETTNVENSTVNTETTVVETTEPTVTETAPAAEAPTVTEEAPAAAPAKTERKPGNGKKNDKRERREPKPTNLVKGDSFPSGVVCEFFPKHLEGALIAVVHNGKEERGLLLPAGLKLDNVRGTTPEQRTELARARMQAIKSGAEGVPALTVTEINPKGARFTETARLEDIVKNAEFKRKREQRASDVEIVLGMQGATIENAEIVGLAVFKDGPRQGEAYGVFARVHGEVDGFVHSTKLKGGNNRLKTLKVGDKLDSVTVETVEPRERFGKADVKVALSELAAFPLESGQKMRNCSYVRTTAEGLVFDWQGFNVLLTDEHRGTVSVKALTENRGQKTHLVFLQVDPLGRVIATKKGA
jgi:hypothetical protein